LPAITRIQAGRKYFPVPNCSLYKSDIKETFNYIPKSITIKTLEYLEGIILRLFNHGVSTADVINRRMR
jgi:hypothetical protein